MQLIVSPDKVGDTISQPDNCGTRVLDCTEGSFDRPASQIISMKNGEGSYMPGSKTLLLVDNTNSGVLEPLKDFSAGTAAASGAVTLTLSSITHSPVGMKKEWKRFLKELEIPSRTLEKIDFLAEFGSRYQQTTFPVVLMQKGTDLSILINTEELSRCRDLNDLILLLRQRLLFE